MRNLKRALSLTLASVMLLGMMVVGTSAASFPDVTAEDNVEAIEVLAAVKVLQGYDDGQYHAENPVTRNQMATIICRMMGWRDSDFAGLNPFPDVPDWAANYVAACVANGIINGRDDGRFHGDDTVTATEAASMMLRALGYTRMPVGAAWAQAVAQQASRINLFKDLSVGANTALTRGDVAQLSLNTLQATMVDVEDNTLNISGGTSDNPFNISGGQINYIVRTSDDDKIGKAIREGTVAGGGTSSSQLNGQTLELGEQVYQGDLKKIEDTDDFGAPAYRWTYKKAEIGTYAKAADVTYTSEVKVKDLYRDMGLSAETTGDNLTIEEDGDPYAGTVTKLVKSGDDGDKKLGGNGVVVKAYKTEDSDDDNIDEVTICIINTYVLQVDGEYNTKKEELQLKALDGTKALPGKTSVKLSGDDFTGLSNYADEDYVLVTVAEEEIKTIQAADTITEAVTAYVAKPGDANSSNVTAGSTYKYDKSYTASDKTYKIGEDYVLVLDNYGYVIFADGVEADDQYVYVAKQASTGGVKADVEADAYFVDGSNDVVIVDKNGAAAANQTWYTYEKKASGKYELTALKAEEVGGNTTAKTSGNIVDTNKSTVAYGASTDTFRANNDTTFIVLRKDNVYVYNGIRNVPKIDAAGSGAVITAVMDGSFAKYVFIEAANSADLSISGSAKEHIYIYDAEPTKSNNADGDPIFTYKVIKDGELTTVNMGSANYTTSTPWDLGLYSDLTTDSNSYIDTAIRIDDATDADLKAYKLDDAKLNIKGDVLTIGGVDQVLADNCKIWVSDGSKTTDITRSQFTRDYAKDPFTGALFLVMDDDIVTEVYVDEDDTAFAGFTADPDTTVGGQPENKDDLKNDLNNQDNATEFEGVEAIVSTGLKQTVSTAAGKTTITVTGTVKGYDKDSTDRGVLEALSTWWYGRYQEGDTIPNGKHVGDLKNTFANMEAAISGVGATGASDTIGIFTVNIKGEILMLIVKDSSGSAVRLGGSTSWGDGDLVSDYIVDISGLKIAK